MQSIKKFYSPLPENADEFDPKDKNRHEDELVDSESQLSGRINETEINVGEVHKDHKSFKESLRDALQEWSNDDARDIEEDDSTPLRSGL